MAEESATTPPSSALNVRGVLWGGAAVAGTIVLAALASFLLWQRWGAPSGVSEAAVPQPPSPALQSAPRQERAQYEAAKRKLLESWEWIDRPRGIARIPVEEAMRIMAEQGGHAAPAGEEAR